MSTYDELFETTRADRSVFATKRALDPLAPVEAVVGRGTQERRLACATPEFVVPAE